MHWPFMFIVNRIDCPFDFQSWRPPLFQSLSLPECLVQQHRNNLGLTARRLHQAWHRSLHRPQCLRADSHNCLSLRCLIPSGCREAVTRGHYFVMVAQAGAQSLLHLALHVPIGSDPDRGERIQEPYRQEGEVAGRLLPLFRRKYEPKTWKVE